MNPPSSETLPAISSTSASVAALASASLYRREGDLLWVRDGAELPRHCLVTGQELEEPDLHEYGRLVWFPRAYRLAIFGACIPLLALSQGSWLQRGLAVPLLVMLILVSCFVQKRARLVYSTTLKIRARQFYSGFFSTGCLLLGGCLLTDAWQEGGRWGAAGILASLTLIATGLFLVARGKRFKVQSYADGWFRLKGCHPAFLDRIGS